MPKVKPEETPLQYVRRRILETPKSGWTRIAADAGITVPTINNILKDEHEPGYMKVMRLRDILMASEAPKRARRSGS